jgi:hypothetical protein
MKKLLLIATAILGLVSFEMAQAGECYIQMYLHKGRACMDPNGNLVTTKVSIFDPNLATAANQYNKYRFVEQFTDNNYSASSALSPQSCAQRARDWLEYCVGKNASLKVPGEAVNAVYVRNNTVILIGNYTYGTPVYKYITNDLGGWELLK